MPRTLDASVVDSIKAGDDADTVLSKFCAAYAGVYSPQIDDFNTMLFCSAIEFQNDALVSHLMNLEYDPNYSFFSDYPTLLNTAVSIQREDYVRMLLPFCASVNFENSSGVTPLNNEFHVAMELAIKLDNSTLAQILMPLFDRLKTRTRRTPLHLACLYGSRQCLDSILNTSEGQNDVNALDADDAHCPDGYSPLMLGVTNGAWLVETLLKHGADATVVGDRTRRTALHLAATGCSDTIHRFVSKDLPQIIRLVVESGCNPNDCERCGDTPLSLLAPAGTVVFGTTHARRSDARVLLIGASPRAGVRPLRRLVGEPGES